MDNKAAEKPEGYLSVNVFKERDGLDSGTAAVQGGYIRWMKLE